MGYARKDVEKTKKIAKKLCQETQNDCDRSCLAGTGKSIEQT